MAVGAAAGGEGPATSSFLRRLSMGIAPPLRPIGLLVAGRFAELYLFPLLSRQASNIPAHEPNSDQAATTTVRPGAPEPPHRIMRPGMRTETARLPAPAAARW